MRSLLQQSGQASHLLYTGRSNVNDLLLASLDRCMDCMLLFEKSAKDSGHPSLLQFTDRLILLSGRFYLRLICSHRLLLVGHSVISMVLCQCL